MTNKEEKIYNAALVNRVKKLRCNLHLFIVSHMKKIGLCNSINIIEDFKRWYLFDFHNVETSRALTIPGLEDAIKHIDSVTLNMSVSGIMLKFNKYTNDKDLLKCTQPQINKIYAICKGSLRMSNKHMYNYIRSTVHRDSFKFNITINEADKVIKRLELYEAKEIRGKQNVHKAS